MCTTLRRTASLALTSPVQKTLERIVTSRSMVFAWDTNTADTVGLTYKFAPADGIIGLISFFLTGAADGTIVENDFQVEDNNGLLVAGFLTFGEARIVVGEVSAPNTLLLFLGAFGFSMLSKNRTP